MIARRTACRRHELSLVAAEIRIDPSVIGGVFNLNDKPFTIVGIAPPSFYGDTLNNAPPDLFLPLATEPLVKGNSALRFRTCTGWI